MRTTIVLASILLTCCSIGSVQVSSKEPAKSVVPVYVNHTGQDATGEEFVAAVKRGLSKSHKYEVGEPNSSAYQRGFRLDWLSFARVASEEIPKRRVLARLKLGTQDRYRNRTGHVMRS